eukprot:2661895-Rhodomonas_salina.1
MQYAHGVPKGTLAANVAKVGILILRLQTPTRAVLGLESDKRCGGQVEAKEAEIKAAKDKAANATQSASRQSAAEREKRGRSCDWGGGEREGGVQEGMGCSEREKRGWERERRARRMREEEEKRRGSAVVLRVLGGDGKTCEKQAQR